MEKMTKNMLENIPKKVLAIRGLSETQQDTFTSKMKSKVEQYKSFNNSIQNGRMECLSPKKDLRNQVDLSPLRKQRVHDWTDDTLNSSQDIST